MHVKALKHDWRLCPPCSLGSPLQIHAPLLCLNTAPGMDRALQNMRNPGAKQTARTGEVFHIGEKKQKEPWFCLIIYVSVVLFVWCEPV